MNTLLLFLWSVVKCGYVIYCSVEMGGCEGLLSSQFIQRRQTLHC